MKNTSLSVKVIKIYVIVTCLIMIGILCSNMIVSSNLNDGETLPYFFKHFSNGICLMLTGTIAFVLPYISEKTYEGNSRGEKAMPFIGLVLFLLGILTIIISY